MQFLGSINRIRWKEVMTPLYSMVVMLYLRKLSVYIYIIYMYFYIKKKWKEHITVSVLISPEIIP